jgi:hypothetical protein
MAKQSKVAQQAAAMRALIRDMIPLFDVIDIFRNSELFFMVPIECTRVGLVKTAARLGPLERN